MSDEPRTRPPTRRDDIHLDALKSAELRAALTDALADRPTRVEDLLARHSGLPGPRPNLALAEAFAEAVRAEPKAAKLLERWTAEDAAPDDPRVFLSIAAAFGWVARLDRDANWDAIRELAADERAPVRIGVIHALTTWVARGDGRIDQLLEVGQVWLEVEDRETRFGAAGVVLDVIATRRSLEGLRETSRLKSWLEAVQAAIADAPRAAERSAGRRRALSALPVPMSHVAALRGEDDGLSWFIGCCERAKHPDLRSALEIAIERVRKNSGHAMATPLALALQSSAKPLRDPTLKRQGLRGRGKKGR